MLNGSLDGTLAWDPAHGGGAAIALPINWTAVRVLWCCVSYEGSNICCSVKTSQRSVASLLLVAMFRLHSVPQLSNPNSRAGHALHVQSVQQQSDLDRATALQAAGLISPWAGSVVSWSLILHASQVPLWAEYRLAVTLQPASNAVVLDTSAAADGTQQPNALHVFGVAQGTCPPGTYLKPRPGCAQSFRPYVNMLLLPMCLISGLCCECSPVRCLSHMLHA